MNPCKGFCNTSGQQGENFGAHEIFSTCFLVCVKGHLCKEKNASHVEGSLLHWLSSIHSFIHGLNKYTSKIFYLFTFILREIFHSWAHSCNDQAGPGWSQDPKSWSDTLTQVAGTQVHKPLSAASQGTQITGSRLEAEYLRPKPDTLIWNAGFPKGNLNIGPHTYLYSGYLGDACYVSNTMGLGTYWRGSWHHSYCVRVNNATKENFWEHQSQYELCYEETGSKDYGNIPSTMSSELKVKQDFSLGPFEKSWAAVFGCCQIGTYDELIWACLLCCQLRSVVYLIRNNWPVLTLIKGNHCVELCVQSAVQSGVGIWRYC